MQIYIFLFSSLTFSEDQQGEQRWIRILHI